MCIWRSDSHSAVVFTIMLILIELFLSVDADYPDSIYGRYCTAKERG